MIGRSNSPTADKDTKLLSFHKRSIRCRSHGPSTCCGSEKKFRKVQIRYTRCAKFGRTYRGPIGVSSSRTPSVSFSIHITQSTSRLTSKARYYCTGNGALEAIFYSWRIFLPTPRIKFRTPHVGPALQFRITREERWQTVNDGLPVFQLISGNHSMRSRVAAMPMPLPSASSTRTTEASHNVQPPDAKPRPRGR